jgi:hypothetical protein
MDGERSGEFEQLFAVCRRRAGLIHGYKENAK